MACEKRSLFAEIVRLRDDPPFLPNTKRPRRSRSNLMAWLEGHGAELGSIRIAPSTIAGEGVFATKALEPTARIAAIPRCCVLSVARAQDSSFGRECKAILGEECSGELVLLAWMALGRTDPEHFFHPYLASLPPGPVGCRFWSEKDRQCLRGTELGPGVPESAPYGIMQYTAWPHMV